MDEVKDAMAPEPIGARPMLPGFSGMALAMMYVPLQPWEEPYDEMTALSRGTIFPSLDKPFLGREGCPQ